MAALAANQLPPLAVPPHPCPPSTADADIERLNAGAEVAPHVQDDFDIQARRLAAGGGRLAAGGGRRAALHLLACAWRRCHARHHTSR